jgi:hypothetical protein
MSKLKLTVNEEKTRICKVPEGEFDFLGYTFGRMYSARTGQARLGYRPWIFAHRVQVIRRNHARHEIHGDIDRRRVQRPATKNHIEGAAPQRTEASRLGDAAPEILQSCPGTGGPAFGMTIDKHRGIHRPSRCAGNTIDFKPRLLEQTIEHAPSKCPMRATALQRKVDKGSRVMAALTASLAIRSSLRKNSPRAATDQRLNMIDGTAIANRPHEARGPSILSPISV